jgi:TP901 family phage tail tape measure protein
MANREIVNRQVNVFIKSGDAQRVYDQLIAKQKKFNDELATATNPKRIDVLKNKLKELEEPISRAAKKISGELEPSLKDTQATVTRLRNELSRMSKEDVGYAEKIKLYRQANKELEEQRIKVGFLSKAWKSFWQEAKTVAVGVIIGNTIQQALQTVLGYVTGIVTGSAKISDELADIQRITGLSKKDVRDLNNELKNIDTRTSASALREIAIVAGKLGISGKKDIAEFTKAVDQLNIALGGELGDINQFTTDLGKILNVFEGKITAENITAVGNAIVDLANKGVASGPFIVDFTQRVAAIAKTSNLSLPAVIGLAAGLEESGLKVESSATAIQKILNDIAGDVPAAAKVAGKSFEEFNKLFSEKPQEALLLYAEGLVKNKESFAEVTAAFKDNGEEGARVVATLATIGQKSDVIRTKMNDAGAAIKDTTAITEAFNLKNNTAGAQLDKLKKAFAGLFQSDGFQAAGESAIKILSTFVGLIKSSVNFIKEHGGLITTLGLVYAALTIKLKFATAGTVLYNAAQAISRTITAASVAAQLIYAHTVDLLTGRIKLATAAQRIWGTVTALGAGPLGLILVAVGAVVVGMQSLIGKTKALTAEQRLQQELSKKTSEILGDQAANVERLAKAAANENLKLSERQKAIQELIRINPAFADTLKINTNGHLEGAAAIAEYIKNLNLKAEAEAKTQLLTEKIRQKNEIINNIRTAFPQLSGLSDDQLIQRAKAVSARIGGINNDIINTANELSTLDAQINTLNSSLTKLANDANPGGNAGNTDGDPNGNAFDIMTASIGELRKKLKELQKELNGENRATVLPQINAIKARIKELLGATKKEVDKNKKEFKDLGDEIAEALFAAGGPGEFDKAIFDLDQKFSKFRQRAKGNVKLLKQIDDLYLQELTNLIVKAQIVQEANLAKASQEQAAAIFKIYEKLGQALQKVFERTNRDKLASAELEVLKSRGKKKLEAELKLLDEQEKQELQKTDLTEKEKDKIRETYRQARRKKNLDSVIEEIQTIVDFVSQAAAIDKIFSDSKTSKENAELQRDAAINDRKRKNLDNRLKQGSISQQQYQRELDRMDKERERKEKEFRKRQFERDKRAQLTQALINFAGASLTTLQKFGPPIPPNFLGIAAMALTVITGLANIAAITKSKAPEFAGGGKLKGPAHSDRSRGMPVSDPYTGRVHAYMEGDEGIINKFSMRDKTTYTMTGTPSQIASKINSYSGRGVSWESGATMAPAWYSRKPTPINLPAITKYYATGGKFTSTSTTDNKEANNESNEVLMHLASTVNNLEKTLAKGLIAYTLLSDNEKARDRRQAIINDATIRP